MTRSLRGVPKTFGTTKHFAIRQSTPLNARRRVATSKSLRFLITAGPTREFLDSARFISNPSSGRTGVELAKAARAMGYRVILIHGPCAVPIPKSRGIRAIGVTSALQMHAEVLRVFPHCDIVIMAAAVSDFRPAHPIRGKAKKNSAAALRLVLKRNPDILAELGRRKTRQILVGFSADTQQVVGHARKKLIRKNLDWIVANQIGVKGSGFAATTNKVWVIARDSRVLKFPKMEKSALARKLIHLFLNSPKD